jgi:transcriptional regulator with XRE-family HTH domain
MSASSIDAVVGRRLRLLRLLVDLTVDDFATLLGMSASDIAAHELGHARLAPAHIATVAEHFKLSVSWFFFTFNDSSFEDCVLDHVEKAAQTRRPQDITFLSRISEIVEAMPYANSNDQSRFIEQARILMRERNSA